jgi:hypothetical protein
VAQRFVADFTVNGTAGFTSGYMLFTPGANNTLIAGNASSAVAVAPSVNAAVAASFLGTSASKMRAVAACTTVVPSAVSMTNITGEIGIAIVSANTIVTTGTYSADILFQLTQKRACLNKEVYEIKWFPGGLDETYAPLAPTALATLSDPADNNSILLVWRGYPAGVQLSIRLTSVLEWTPGYNIGTAVSSIPRDGVDVFKQANALHKANPNWWHKLGAELAHDVSSAARYLGRAGLAKGVQYLSGTVGPALLAL